MNPSPVEIKYWIKSLPRSRMVFPDTLAKRAKYFFWRAYTPYHPILRDALVSVGLVRHRGRQNYLLGTITPDLSTQEFIMQLVEQGFGRHLFALKDEGELVSLRYVDGFEYQYHLRVFVDREVRGHYELTPECYPISHMRAEDQVDRRDEFTRFLQGKVI